MTREQILTDVRQVFEEHLSIPEIRETTHLYRDLALDSIQQLTLVVELENRFRVVFEEGDEQALSTVSDVVDLVSCHIDEQRRAGNG